MAELTKERLQQLAIEDDLVNYPPEQWELNEMARQLLASMEQEPVAWRYRFVHTPKSEEHGSYFTTDWVLTHSEDECNPSDCFERQPLYAAPQLPQPAVPTFDEWCAATDNKPLGWVKDAMRDAYDGCRAAMLQAGNSPETPDGSEEALSEAVAAIYFDDSSDYCSALWSVVRAISPKIAELLESNERAAFDATRLPAAPKQEVK